MQTPAPNYAEYPQTRETGLTLVELLVSLTILGILLTGLNGVLNQALGVWGANSSSLTTSQDAYFAMDRIGRAIQATQHLLLPAPDNPNTSQIESLRNVIALTMDPRWDRDNDGFMDADNDKDGRIDEDPPRDSNDDGYAGIAGIDDDFDGNIDNSASQNNDESGTSGDDPLNGIDDDGDGNVDEDYGTDMNGDGQPGIAGVDDDGDGNIDEGSTFDDDEDGSVGEDWVDTIAYFLSGTDLIERLPNINPLDGEDYTERSIANDVTSFTAERIQGPRYTSVKLRLTLTNVNNQTVSVARTIRVGSRR